MAPATDVKSSSNNNQVGTITLAVLVSVGGSIAITFLFVIALLAWRRRRRRRRQTPTTDSLSYRVPPPHLRCHRLNPSDSSVDPLLIDKSKVDVDEDYREKWLPQHFTSAPEDKATRDARDIVLDNPAGLYHMPSVQMSSPAANSPTPSSGCLPYSPRSPSVRPPLPVLPPLIIPGKQAVHPHSISYHPSAVAEEPEDPPSSSVSSVSHYSQYSAGSSPGTPPPTFAPQPLSQELEYDTVPLSDEPLRRNDTRVVGGLLKARAQRNPEGLVRADTQVSHIERTGSIKSVASTRKSSRPYAKRYRSRKQRTPQVNEMGTVNETSEGASLRSRSDSLNANWDPSLLYNLPLDVPPLATKKAR